ncbi:MAG: hypothetical protein LBB59_03440 [Campylobacteraceae bacterium]|nr:hypothetical protein [Campylobacteraceae bacterium]
MGLQADYKANTASHAAISGAYSLRQILLYAQMLNAGAKKLSAKRG